MAGLIQELSVAIRALILVVSSLILVASFRVTLSSNGHLLVVLQFLVALILTRPKSLRRFLLPLSTLALILFGVVIYHSRNFPNQPIKGELLHHPSHSSISSLAKLVTEEDGIFVSTSLFSAVGEITPREATGIWPPLLSHYQRMRENHGQFPSPLPPSYLGMEGEEHFEVLHLRAKAENPQKKSLIFLHGFGGNWTLLCFLVSESVSPLGYDTFCPTTGPLGQWSHPSGTKILRQTIAMLRERGYQPELFSGLSAGAIGGAMIAKDFLNDFKGFIFLFGGHPDAEVIQKPTLYIFGNQDERIPSRLMKSIIEIHQKKNSKVASVEMSADHFALLKLAEQVQDHISDWVRTNLISPIVSEPSHLGDQNLPPVQPQIVQP